MTDENRFYCIVFSLSIVTLACSADNEGETLADGGLELEKDAAEIATGEGRSNDASVPERTTSDADVEDSTDRQTEGGTNTIPSSLGILDPDWTIPDALMLCDDGPCQCANGIDDDGDGQIDGFDIECTGANDDDEGTFATGIPGDNSDPKWQDCFFDGDSGSGNDGCRYHTDCLTGDKDPSDPDCQVSQECVDYCLERTPNGCDCFGCCTIALGNGESVNVFITVDCEAESLEACIECVPTTDCSNECGECELCPGKAIEDLPDHCWDTLDQPDAGTETNPDGGGTATPDGGSGEADGGDSGSPGRNVPYTCDDGKKVCASHSDCDAGDYCWQGCCTPILI